MMEEEKLIILACRKCKPNLTSTPLARHSVLAQTHFAHELNQEERREDP